MAKVVLRGRDYTRFEEFTFEFDEELSELSVMYINLNTEEKKKEFNQLFAHVVFDYAIKKHKVLKQGGDGEACVQLESPLYEMHKGDNLFKLKDIYREDKHDVALVGCFSVTIPHGEYKDKDWPDIAIKDYFQKDGEMEVYVTLNCRFDTAEKPYFLIRMLECANPNLQLEMSEFQTSQNEIWEYLMYQVYRNALKSLYHLGFYRKYVVFRKNDTQPKGRIDIAQHIRHNAGKNNGCIASIYNEKTFDNSLNHFILQTYELLKKPPYTMLGNKSNEDSSFASIIKELKVSAPSWKGKSISILSGENVSPITSPYYQPYEKMRKICQMIYRHSGTSLLLEQDENSADGFLIYVPDLFERYVEISLRKVIDENDNLNRRYLFEIQKKFSRPNPKKKTFRPDYVLCGRDKKHIYAVLDAKFKPKYQTMIMSENRGERIIHLLDDAVDDCKKLCRDIVYTNIIEFNTWLDYNKDPAKGAIIYPFTCCDDVIPRTSMYKENIIPIENGERKVKYDGWKRYFEKEWYPDDNLKESYLVSAYGEYKQNSTNRRYVFESMLSPYGKEISYIGVPVADIRNTEKYSDWRERQEALESGLSEAFKRFVESFE